MSTSEQNITSSQHITTAGLLIGLCFPIMAWFIDIAIRDFPISFSSILTIHEVNPLHYMIDSAPLILGGLSFYLASIIRQTELKSEKNTRSLKLTLDKVLQFTGYVGKGEFDFDLELGAEQSELSITLENMRNHLIEVTGEQRTRQWRARGIAEVGTMLREHETVEEVTLEIIKYVSHYIDGVQGAFYLMERNKLNMKSRYAYGRKKYEFNSFKIGQGLVGQCAFEMNTIYRREIPDDFVSITSGLIEDKKPSEVLLVPLIANEQLYGVFEFASLNPITPAAIHFVETIGEMTGRTIFNLITNAHTAKLLEESQKMGAELKVQQHELEKNSLEMKQAKEDLEVSNENLELQIKEVENQQKKLHALLSKSSEIITIYDVKLTVKYKSPSVEHILGFKASECIGKNDFKVNGSEADTIIMAAFEKVLDDSSTHQTIEFQSQKKNGEIVWMEANLTNLLDDPAINGIVMNSRDITERREAEKEQEMRAKMQALSENSQDIILRFDLEGTFMYVNPRLKYYTGINKAFTGLNNAQAGINPDIVRRWNKIIADVCKEQKLIQREMFFETNIDEYIMQVNAIPEFNAENEVESVLVVLHDVTKRKKQEIEIQETNKKITESINYAKRIQNAIIPVEEQLRQEFNDFMMFYMPKDVVSGDFPWYYKKDNCIYIAAVDCTGHGVPGAMMSLIGCLLLNDLANDSGDFSPSEILLKLHKAVVNILKQDVKGNNTSDGMDIAMCRIDLESNQLQFSGAHRPLYLVRNNEIKQYSGSPFPIGGMQYRGRNTYKNHSINIAKGDAIYFFSDGLPDQFGENGEDKYSPQRIREVILTHQDKSMKELENIFKDDLMKWMGKEKQLDDVLLMGISF